MVTQAEMDTRIAKAVKKAEAGIIKEPAAKPAVHGSGGCYCRHEKRGKGCKGKTSGKICSCGYKARGKNHEEGAHHKSGKLKK